MTRSFHLFDCEGDTLAGTLDDADGSTGLLIVSGGNEIRSGAHSGMARLAASIATERFPVFRYDRRGVGDSGGENQGYLASQDDIAAAANEFKSLRPAIKRIVAFGNCDAATAIILFGHVADCEHLILANPWVFEDTQIDDQASTSPTPSAVRARYWERLKNPRTFIDLFRGQINFGKLLRGLAQASKKETKSDHANLIFQQMFASSSGVSILLAERDTTARAFLGAWKANKAQTQKILARLDVEISSLDSASHSFADEKSRRWLERQILDVLRTR